MVREQDFFPNDDHSPFAGPDYRERGETSQNNSYEARHGKEWFHPSGAYSFSGMGAKSYERSDTRIYEDVCEALLKSSEIDASQMDVSVKEGIVTLSGEVPHRSMKIRAEEILDTLAGVVDIINAVKVTGREKQTQEWGKL